MSNIIKPTIGRKVWYRHDGAPLVSGLPAPWTPTSYGDQPMDATVVYVWGDRMVNLRVTDHAGNTFVVTSVTLVQPGDAIPGSRHCEWMPYQTQQHQKAAAIDRAIMATTPIGGSGLQFEHQPTAQSASFGVAPAVKPGESPVGFSLDDDKPLSGGVCDMSAGCEACQ